LSLLNADQLKNCKSEFFFWTPHHFILTASVLRTQSYTPETINVIFCIYYHILSLNNQFSTLVLLKSDNTNAIILT